MPKLKHRPEEVANAIKEMQQLFDEGVPFIIVMKHRASSGMSRGYAVYFMQNNKLYCANYMISLITDRSITNKDTIVMRGCGSDFANDLMSEVAYRINRNVKQIQIYKV